MRATAILAAAALLYGAAAHAGNTSPSQLDAEAQAALKAMLPEDMSGFELHAEPRPFRDKPLVAPDGDEVDLHVFDGHVTVLNFWAVWCPPCLKELPSLDALQAALGDEGVKVVAVSVDRKGQDFVEAFLEERKLDNLEPWWDEKSRLAKEMGILGIPVTAILGPDAREIGRLRGDADWAAEGVQEMLRLIVRETGGARE